MSQLWRCLNPKCSDALVGHPQFDFEAADGTCPRCGKTHRQAPHAVVERVAVHYLVSDPAGPVRTPHGNRQVACQPAARQLPPHCTAVAAVVTCPKCRETLVVKKHEADQVDQHQDIIKLSKVG